MKKNILVCTFLISVLVFSGCDWFASPDNDVVSLRFSVAEDSVPEEFYAEAELKVVPDYELRTLAVDYTLFFPYRTEMTDLADIDTEGVIGGDYFDRFEDIIGILKMDTYEEIKNEELKVVGAYNFIVEVEREGEKVDTYWLGWHEEFEKFEEIDSFYIDVVALFMEDVY